MSAKYRTLLLASTFVIGGTMAFAQSAADGIVTDLVADGFTRVEVKTGLTQTKIEAVRGSDTRELVIDNATGDILKSEDGVLEAGDDKRPGIFSRTRDRDTFLSSLRGDRDDDRNGRDDDDDDDDGRGRDNDNSGRGGGDDGDHDGDDSDHDGGHDHDDD